MTQEEWGVLEYGNIPLNAGINTITISTWWGYMYVDYFIVDDVMPSAYSPDPAHLATVGTDLAQLCWNNPAPEIPGDTITSDVYLGTDPNGILLSQIATGTTDTCVGIPISLQQYEDYYWRVNCYDPNGGLLGGPETIFLPGGLWEFGTGNSPPDPNAGPDQFVWLGKGGTPGEVTVNIDARVTDDGLPSGTLTYFWEQTNDPCDAPDVTIDPNNVEDISITFTEEGDYAFSLTVSDGQLQAIDTVAVGVRQTPCEAAQADDWYWYFEPDINEDCFVDLQDFAFVAIDWLKCVAPAGCL